MKKICLLMFSALLFTISSNVSAQVVGGGDDQTESLDGFYTKQINKKAKKPFVYPYVREDDVAWEHRIWRTVDFREKMNQVFYYPQERNNASEGSNGIVNLFNLIDKAGKEGVIKVYADDEFKQEKAWDSCLMAGTRHIQMSKEDPNLDGELIQYDSTIARTIENGDVKALRIKEDWFVDKKRSVQDVRIIGICLISTVVTDVDGTEQVQAYPLGWIRFNDPEVRNLFANAEVYNPYNDAIRLTFDDVFQKRLFTSYVTRETNRFERKIDDYVTGMDALAESERIEAEVLEVEQSMWEY